MKLQGYQSRTVRWASDESYSSPKGHHQVGESPIGYQCLVILHTCVCPEIAGSAAINLEILFFAQMVESNNHSDVEEEDEAEELFASSSWLYVAILLVSIRCLCWALLLRLSNCDQLCLLFWKHLLVECLHRRLAACIFDLSLRIPHCSSLLALLHLPMSLDSGKRESETVRHTTWIKCIESETRHTYTWSIWCWQKKGRRYGFSWCNPKLLWPLGFPSRFVMAFG